MISLPKFALVFHPFEVIKLGPIRTSKSRLHLNWIWSTFGKERSCIFMRCCGSDQVLVHYPFYFWTAFKEESFWIWSTLLSFILWDLIQNCYRLKGRLILSSQRCNISAWVILAPNSSFHYLYNINGAFTPLVQQNDLLIDSNILIYFWLRYLYVSSFLVSLRKLVILCQLVVVMNDQNTHLSLIRYKSGSYPKVSCKLSATKRCYVAYPTNTRSAKSDPV